MPKYSPYVSRIILLSSSKMLRIILFERTPVFFVTLLLTNGNRNSGEGQREMLSPKCMYDNIIAEEN
jgi:hypothetical protein